MDVNFINNNENKVRELQANIGTVVQRVETANEKALQALKKFRNSIDEDGFNKIASYVNRAHKKAVEAEPHMKLCASELVKMADKLKKLRDGLK